MPYRIARLSSCPPDRPYAVVLVSNNSTLGCHADMASAERQIAAIEISERTETEKQQPTSSAVHVETIMNPKKRKPKYTPTVLFKGDYIGHPFRGNQWTDASGISRSLASGSASDGDRVDLRGVATVEEARRTGRPLAMLQPENFSAGVQAALGARFEAIKIEKNLLKDNPEQDPSDPRFIVAEYASKLAFYEVFKQISRDYALALGFTEVTGEEAEKAKFEDYTYEHLGRNGDGRLTREELTVYPRDMTGEKYAMDERGSVVWRDGNGKLQFWFVGEEQPPEFTERYGEKSSFEGIDLRSLADPSSIDPDSYFKIDSEESGAQMGPKAVAFANQEMQKRMRALGIKMPDLQPFARLSGKALVEKLRADGDPDPKATVGRLIDHVENVAKKLALFYAPTDSAVKYRGHNLNGSEDFQIDKQINDITPDAKISVTIPANKVSAILKDGRLKTQFETQRSGGANMPTWREDWEAVMFGFPIGSNPSVRPIYGMVETGGVQPSSLRGNEQYGTVTLVLKDSVRDRTTFSDGDSLNLNPFHAPVNDPSIRTVNRNSDTSLGWRERFKETRANNPLDRGYYEAQIHGGVQVSDIERVVIDTSTYKDFEQQEVQPSPALIKALTKAGLPFEIVQGKPPTQPKVDKALFNPFVLIKGDFVGHPFRGNQWTDSSGVSRSPTSAPEDTSSKPRNVGGRPMIRHSAGRYESAEGLQFVKGSPPTAHWDVYRSEDDYDPLYESGRGSLQEAMRDFDDFRDANTQKALVDARDADLSLLHTEREVKIVEDTSNSYGVGTRFENKIFLGGVPTTLGTKTNKIIHSSKQAAEKAQKKVVAEMEEILADPTLQVKALEENLWEYTYNYKIGDRVARATSRARFDKPLPETESEQVTKFETSAWQRKAGKNPKGGLNAAGRAAYNRETGGNLKPPVKSGDNPRRASFLARMGNNAGPERDENGEPTRLLLSLQAWGAESKADARAKAKAISARNANKMNKFAFGFLKGDFVGHPFRGNQWTDSSGASTGATRSQTVVADKTSPSTQFLDFIAGEKDFRLRQAKERDELNSRKPDTFANPELKGGIEIYKWLKESEALNERQATEQDNRDYYRYNELKDKLTNEELNAIASEKPPADAQEYSKVGLLTARETARGELSLRRKTTQPKPEPSRRVDYEQSSVAHKDLMAQRAYAGGESLGAYESDWQGDGWKAISEVQTNPKSRNAEFAAPVIEAFKEAMIEVNKSTILYRGMGSLKLDTLDTDFPVGTKIKSKTFISTTTDPATAMSFTKSQGAIFGLARRDENLPILRITVSKGRKVLPLTGDEFEVVLDSPSTMTVTGRSKVMTLDGEVEVLDVKVS